MYRYTLFTSNAWQFAQLATRISQRIFSMEKPVVAYITTMYSGDNLHYIEQALSSLQAQSYGAEYIHIYLYVDGSVPPAHKQFLDHHARSFYKIIKDETNRGLPHGLNKLIDSLEDEPFVLRMDMDDICDSLRTERQVKFLQNNPDIAIVGCCSREIDETGEVVYERDYPETPELIRSAIAKGNPMLHPTYCLRREVLTEHGLRYKNQYLNEDLQFLFDLLAAGLKPYNLQERLFYWRLTESFFKRRSIKRCVVEFRVYFTGIYRLFGITTQFAYPVIRLIFRLMPNSLAQQIYKSSIRNKFLTG